MARIKIKNLAKGKKATDKELKKRGEKPLGEPVDVTGLAGGGCGCMSMAIEPGGGYRAK